MDVVDRDERNANHVWIRQAVTWPGRAFTGGEQAWQLGPTKGKRFRKVAVSAPLFDRLRLYIDAHSRGAKALVFDYPLLRAEHAARQQTDPRPVRFPTGRYVSPTTGRSGAHGKAHTYSLGCRCPYCRNANTEARFWARRAKGAQPAAPWLDADYLTGRSHEVDPVKYHWFTRSVFGHAVAKARLDWSPTFHDLRHGMVSWSYDAGASPAVVQRDAGHANIRTTQGYMQFVTCLLAALTGETVWGGRCHRSPGVAVSLSRFGVDAAVQRHVPPRAISTPSRGVRRACICRGWSAAGWPWCCRRRRLSASAPQQGCRCSVWSPPVSRLCGPRRRAEGSGQHRHFWRCPTVPLTRVVLPSAKRSQQRLSLRGVQRAEGGVELQRGAQ